MHFTIPANDPDKIRRTIERERADCSEIATAPFFSIIFSGRNIMNGKILVK
jgi:hypothetical protein